MRAGAGPTLRGWGQAQPEREREMAVKDEEVAAQPEQEEEEAEEKEAAAAAAGRRRKGETSVICWFPILSLSLRCCCTLCIYTYIHISEERKMFLLDFRPLYIYRCDILYTHSPWALLLYRLGGSFSFFSFFLFVPKEDCLSMCVCVFFIVIQEIVEPEIRAISWLPTAINLIPRVSTTDSTLYWIL